jgi:hypothetical protein
MPQKVNYSDTTPAADANNQLLRWKADAPSSDPTITRNISVEAPLLTASGAGHQAGLAPDPGSSAGITKFLREDATWAAPAGGGGSGTAYVQAGPPDAPPQTPNAMDDEFPGTSLNGKWTRLQSGAITDSYSLGRLILTAVTGGSFLITQAKPASPCEFTAAFTIDTNSTAGGNNVAIGLMFGDGTKLVTLNFGWINSSWHFEVENWTNSTTFSSSPAIVSNPWGASYLAKLYLRIKDDGTNFLFSVSNDGYNFTQIASVGRTAFMATPSTVGIFSFGGAGGTGGFTCDWFRRTDGGYVPVTVPPAAAISIAYAGLPATLNVTTEGVLDWLIWGSNTTPPDLQTNFGSGTGGTSGTYRKGLGGLQIFTTGPVGNTSMSAGGAFPTTTFSFTAGDARSTVSAGSFTISALNFLTGANNNGLMLRVPCDSFTRVLRLYVSNGNPYTVQCVSSDGSISHTESRTGSNDKITITYNGSRDGGFMMVFLGNDGAHTSNICLAAATLALT